LTAGESIDEYPQFAPDGERIAFISNRGGQRALWLVAADGGTPRRLLEADVLPYFSWSPDGREIVYSTPEGELPGLSVVGVEDGRVRRLATAGGATAPAWSPAGDVIAYLEVTPNAPERQGGAFVRFMTPKGEPVPRDIGQTLALSNGFLAWSRTGQALAAVRVGGTNSASVWIADLKRGAAIRRVLTLPNDALVRGVVWSADDRSLILGQERASSDIVLFERGAAAP
jgi:Tol biopolymer transport system component